MRQLRIIRVCLAIVIAGLVISGVTAFPLEWELGIASSVLHATPAADLLPGFVAWVDRVHGTEPGSSPYASRGSRSVRRSSSAARSATRGETPDAAKPRSASG